jgi:putative membrane protein
MTRRRNINRFLLGFVVLALVVSGIDPFDRMTWALEVLPILVGLPVVLGSYQRFPLTSLSYWLLTIHALILIVGGHYTYSNVPLGFWLQDLFDMSRNHYDRLGHLAQGFVPAVVAREVLLRMTPIQRGGWLNFLVVCVCLAISAFYEMIEWWVAVAAGVAAEAFLATQGDVWDTQWDMFLALLGAISAVFMLGRVQDRQLDSMGIEPAGVAR